MLDSVLGIDEPPFAQQHFVPHRVPVLLLRRMLLRDARVEPTMPTMPLAGYCRDTELPRIFCSFRKTLAYVLTDAGRALAERRVVARRGELERRYQLDVPPAVVHNGRACSVIVAALLRIAVAYDMRHEVRTNARHRFTLDATVQYYEYQLQLFADTHLDLLLGAEMRGAFDDTALDEPLSASTVLPPEMLASDAPLHGILLRSVYERCYPHPLRAPSAGEMADLTNATLSADLWTKASDNTRSRVTELIHNVESKMMNHRCGGRNFAKMVCEMWGYNRPSLTFINNVLELHSLGNYPGVVLRPGVRSRLAVRRAYSLDSLQSEPWCAWCHYADTTHCPLPGCDHRNAKKRQRLHKAHICPACTQFAQVQTKLCAAVREFCVYMVQCHGVLDYMMRIDSEWTAYTNVVLLAANESRAFTERMYASRTRTPAEMVALQTQQMEALELVAQCNKSVQRLRKDYKFAELMCRMCNHAHTKILCETWSGPQQPEDFLMAPRTRSGGRRFEDRRLQRMNACFAAQPHLDGQMWCDVYSLEQLDAVAQVMLHMAGDLVVSLLHLVGVSPRCHTAVQDLHRNSELRNMPDNSFKAACIELCTLFPVDFHVLHYLLKRICHHDQFRVMSLDERSAVAQVKALRARHMVLPWQPLPPVDRLYFCEGEFRVYADIVEPLDETLAQRAVDECADGDALGVTNAPFGTGPKGALYSHATEMLHCTRPPSSSIAKKFKRDGLMEESEFFGESEQAATETDRCTAKSIRVAQQAQRSCAGPLKFVSLVGKIVRIGPRIYTLCTVCAAPFVVASNSLSNNGFTCGRHVQLADANCYTALREFATRHTHELTSQAPAPAPVPSTTTSASASASTTRHNRCNVVPLVECFSTFERGSERQHTRIGRVLLPLCAPSNVRPRAPPLEKLYCIGTPCFEESKFKSNSDLLSWAAQLGEQAEPTRVIARRFGITAAPSLAERLEQRRGELERCEAAAEQRRVEMALELEFSASRSANALFQAARREADAAAQERRAELTREIARLEEQTADATRLAEAAAAAIEAAEAAKVQSGLSLAEAERMSQDAVASGMCLQRVAITCAFCYARCERNGCFTRLNVVDVNGVFIEPLWQRKIATRGRIDVWLCRNDFERVEYFLRSQTLVMASDLWDALVETKRRANERRLAFQQRKK